MGLMNEYTSKRWGPNELLKELNRLIKAYNEARKTYLLVYAAAVEKPIPDSALCMDDCYAIRDLLGDKNSKGLDFYVETPGGRGDAAEEIVRFTREKFEKVNFVISGEAKSAGTILALSGDEILMTNSGSLGPIDAQLKIGRSTVSAHDYLEWVESKREEAERMGKLNPFDAVIVAQISPGELNHVLYAQKFSEDLVKDWLPKYKFKNWVTTETRGIQVTPEMRQIRANEIAVELLNHARWRSHGRSIKISDLESIGLQVVKIDNDPELADIIYRMQTIIRLLFLNTTIYKIIATDSGNVIRQAVSTGETPKLPPNLPANALTVEAKCQKCGEVRKIYAKLDSDPDIDKQFAEKGFEPYPKTDKFMCKCGYEIDLSGFRNEMEARTGKKFIV